MPIVHTFNTRDPENPSSFSMDLPETYIALPRFAHGFRELDVCKDNNIRVKSAVGFFTKLWASCHTTGWNDTNLHRAAEDAFVIAANDREFQTGTRMRDCRNNPQAPASVRVVFERPFPTPPKVVVFLSHIDLGTKHNWRLKTCATDIDRKGFTLTIETWEDTVLYAAEASWIAYPAERDNIYSTSVNTMDVRPFHSPQLQHSKTITFGNVNFTKIPSIFCALNSIDIDSKINLRVRAYVDKVSKTGLVWHIDAWHDTILYTAGASIIAVA